MKLHALSVIATKHGDDEGGVVQREQSTRFFGPVEKIRPGEPARGFASALYVEP